MKELKQVYDCVKTISTGSITADGEEMKLRGFGGDHTIMSEFGDEIKNKFGVVKDMIFVNLEELLEEKDYLGVILTFLDTYNAHNGNKDGFWFQEASSDEKYIMIVHDVIFNTANPETGKEIVKDFYAVDFIKKEDIAQGPYPFTEEKLYMIDKIGMIIANEDMCSAIVDLYGLDPEEEPTYV